VGVLLTGFEPFGGQDVNASWLVVQAVAAGWSGSAELVTAVLPVSFARAPVELREALGRVRPDVVVCTGEAGGRASVGIERVAVNRADAEIADNDGSRPVDVPVVSGAPDGYLTTLPARECLAAVQALGIPVEISSTAGTFVCNAVFFALRDLVARGGGPARVGFVHLPRTPEQVPDGGAALPVAASAAAVAAVIAATVARVAVVGASAAGGAGR
jgi:pyroglutamyl-peptidase